MSWRIVAVTKPSKLDYNMGYLVVRDVDDISKVYLDDISVLIVENTSCSVTTALLCNLIKNKTNVIFCDEKRNPCSELMSLYGSHDCSARLKKQIKWDDFSKQRVWTEIVAQKIKNQAKVLKCFGLSQYEMLLKYIDELEFNDASNREGHAAKVYFNALFGKDFSRNDDRPENAALDYGYSILLSCFNREIVSCGYNTQLGLFHDNIFNQFNLGCDLMEPFRPIVDRFVKENNVNDFTKDIKYGLINLLNSELKTDGRVNTLLNTIGIYSKSVFAAIEQSDFSLLKFPETE